MDGRSARGAGTRGGRPARRAPSAHRVVGQDLLSDRSRRARASRAAAAAFRPGCTRCCGTQCNCADRARPYGDALNARCTRREEIELETLIREALAHARDAAKGLEEKAPY